MTINYSEIEKADCSERTIARRSFESAKQEEVLYNAKKRDGNDTITAKIIKSKDKYLIRVGGLTCVYDSLSKCIASAKQSGYMTGNEIVKGYSTVPTRKAAAPTKKVTAPAKAPAKKPAAQKDKSAWKVVIGGAWR